MIVKESYKDVKALDKEIAKRKTAPRPTFRGVDKGRRPGLLASNPERLKWCAGPCGRILAVTCYYTNGQGWPQSDCKACHRVNARLAARRRYRYSFAHRQAQRARARAWYAANRERKCAYEREHWPSRGKQRRLAKSQAAA